MKYRLNKEFGLGRSATNSKPLYSTASGWCTDNLFRLIQHTFSLCSASAPRRHTVFSLVEISRGLEPSHHAGPVPPFLSAMSRALVRLSLLSYHGLYTSWSSLGKAEVVYLLEPGVHSRKGGDELFDQSRIPWSTDTHHIYLIHCASLQRRAESTLQGTRFSPGLGSRMLQREKAPSVGGWTSFERKSVLYPHAKTFAQTAGRYLVPASLRISCYSFDLFSVISLLSEAGIGYYYIYMLPGGRVTKIASLRGTIPDVCAAPNIPPRPPTTI